MNSEFISKTMWKAHYTRKPAAPTTFLLDLFTDIDSIKGRKAKDEEIVRRQAQTDLLLPYRISLTTGDGGAKVANTGRGSRERAAKLDAHFTQPQKSPYMIAKPFNVHTSLWAVPGTKRYFFGTIGINMGEGQKVQDNGDLIFLRTADWDSVDVFIFRGLATPNGIASFDEVLEFLEGKCA